MFLLEQDNIEISHISIHLKKYKMCRFGITHDKRVANKQFFRYCLVHILRLLIS